MPKTAAGQEPADLDKLIAGIASGSTQSLSQLYRQTRTSVYSFALSILKNSMDAEDVLQDCYIHIYHAAGSYKSQNKPMAWILTITKNLSLKCLREQKRTISLWEADRNSLLAASDSMDAESKVVLEGCMKLLTDQQRQIVVLHAVAGLKHRQIADLLGLKLSTVLSKYHRAIQKMKASL